MRALQRPEVSPRPSRARSETCPASPAVRGSVFASGRSWAATLQSPLHRFDSGGRHFAEQGCWL